MDLSFYCALFHFSHTFKHVSKCTYTHHPTPFLLTFKACQDTILFVSVINYNFPTKLQSRDYNYPVIFFKFAGPKSRKVDEFYRTHRYLIEHLKYPIARLLMDEIDWSHRLIGIKGSRGVGKTAFLLAYAKQYFGYDKSCLYINLNNFYFTQRSLVDFADEFSKKGGKSLLIDQVYKYPNWSKELKTIYDRFPDLHVVFSGSTVMRLKYENPDLNNLVASYNLRGFSFREFINHEVGLNFKAYTLEEIMKNHQSISREITSKIRPLAYFQDYLHHGFYPFYLEKSNFSESLLKTMNLMLEIDISYLQQIELKYLPKLRNLLFLIAKEAPVSPNVSQLSNQINTSRATVMNYVKYLKDARLFNLLYPVDEEFPKKPAKVYMHNTNLLFAIDRDYSNQQSLCETFFYNMVHKDHKVNSGSEHAPFLIDKKIQFDVKTSHKKAKQKPNVTYAVDMIEKGGEDVIPLWLFGFLY